MLIVIASLRLPQPTSSVTLQCTAWDRAASTASLRLSQPTASFILLQPHCVEPQVRTLV